MTHLPQWFQERAESTIQVKEIHCKTLAHRACRTWQPKRLLGKEHANNMYKAQQEGKLLFRE